MKKIRSFYFAMMAIASLSFLTSCGDEDEPNPKATITFDPSAETVNAYPGQALNVKFVVTSADKLNSFVLSKETAGIKQEVANVTSFPNSGFEYQLTETVSSSAVVGSTIVYTVTATTNKDEVTTRTYTVNVVSDLATYTAKILGNQNATAGSFFSSVDGLVLSSADAKANSAKVDLVFYHSNPTDPSAGADAATLASPDDAKAQAIYGSGTTANIPSWATKNVTKFKKLPAAQSAGVYEGVTSGSQIQQGYTVLPSAEASSSKNLIVGDVVGFKTAAGKHGMAKVTAVTAPTVANGNKSEITLSIKVQR